MTGEGLGQVPFQAHVEILQLFLARREAIVESIQGVLNAQRKPNQYLQDRPLLSRHFEDCFFTLTSLTTDQSRLRDQLEEAHWATGFRPHQIPGLHNDLIDPAEMMIRGFYFWQRTRWPGRSGRVRYAHTLFDLYVLRKLELLSMRLWDAGLAGAGDRLAQVQDLLDELWRCGPPDGSVLVRDARWLIPLAQSPTTDGLAAYFEVAQRIAETLSEADRLETQKTHVRMIGGHLRSQIRHYCIKDRVSLSEQSVVLRTRTSNALDFALLAQNLVSLLEAYEHACHRGDGQHRLELADAICQGISPDPELFLNRVDLLRAYSMIEHVFIATDRDGQIGYTRAGRRHIRLLREYEALIDRWAKPLSEDCRHFRPVDGVYSPYGVMYGTPTNLIEDMALKTLDRDAVTHFSLEDIFADGDANGDRLAWVNGWRKLPHIDAEVQRLYDYPREFAGDIFARIERALRRRVSDGEASDVPKTGRLFILPGDDLLAESKTSPVPALPARYIESSDMGIVTGHKAEAHDQTHLLRDREEGHFVVSFQTSGGWVAVKKDILTEVLGAGHDARIVGLPPVAAEVLGLMCPDLVISESVAHRHQASVPPSMLKA